MPAYVFHGTWGRVVVNRPTGPPGTNLFLNSTVKFVSGSDAATWCLGDALGWPGPAGEGHPWPQGSWIPDHTRAWGTRTGDKRGL